MQQGGHLVDESAGTAGTGAVHALLRGGMEIGNFGVFPTQLDNHISLRVSIADCFGTGDNFLHERHFHGSGNRESARTGNRSFYGNSRMLRVNIAQQARQFPAHIRMVAAIVGKNHLPPRKEHCFYGGGTNIDT